MTQVSFTLKPVTNRILHAARKRALSRNSVTRSVGPASRRAQQPFKGRPGSLSSPRPPRLGSFYYAVGRPFLGALLTLILILPMLVVGCAVAIAVAIDFRDHKKVFFAQQRMGRGGRPFTIWKFRTMHASTEGHFDSWREGQEQDRVTRLGKILRRSHLDELPQFWNILRGDMAYIGPRPEMVEVHWWAQRSVPGFDARLWVKPGISGLAQLGQGYVGSDVEAYGHKLDADLQYLSRLTFLQDFSILCRTPLWMLRLRGWGPGPVVVMTPAKPAVPKVSGGVARSLDSMTVEASRIS